MQEVTINKQTRLSEHLASPSEATLGQTSELDSSHLSPHFSLGELTKTSARTADGNIPSHAHIENLRRLCRWLELLRSRWNMMYGEGNDPLIINSGYRSPQVNKAVGGVATSNHLTAAPPTSESLARSNSSATPPSCSTSATRPTRTSMNSCWSVRLAAPTGSTSPCGPRRIGAR